MKEVYDSMALKQKTFYTYEDILALPDGIRAELIDHTLYSMAPPTRLHQSILLELAATLRNTFKNRKGNCKVYIAPFGVRLTEQTDTYLEPDISVICNPDKLTETGCVGAPDWIIEILSPSTYLKDTVLKLSKYGEAGVREYWIIDPSKELISVWNFARETETNYTFSDTIPVGIYENFSIDFSELDFSIS